MAKIQPGKSLKSCKFKESMELITDPLTFTLFTIIIIQNLSSKLITPNLSIAPLGEEFYPVYILSNELLFFWGGAV